MSKSVSCKKCGKDLSNNYMSRRKTNFYGIEVYNDRYWCSDCKKERSVLIHPQLKTQTKASEILRAKPLPKLNLSLPKLNLSLPKTQTKEDLRKESLQWLKDQDYEYDYDANGTKYWLDDEGDRIYINSKGYLVDEDFKDYFE